MSKIDCGDGATVCRCDRITGCGHLSSWHRVFERWMARCLMPGCDCATMDACNCVEGLDGSPDEGDAKILAEMGVTL